MLFLTADVPAGVQNALGDLLPGWTVKSVPTLPHGHPASLLFGALIEHDPLHEPPNL